MERAPRTGGIPAREDSGEQATRTPEATAAPAPFAVPRRLFEVDSTNRYLVDLCAAGLEDGLAVPDGYAVIAERQTAGRGRLGRRWEAPEASSVLCSILLLHDLAPDQLHLLTWAVALAAADACEEVARVDVTLKWPNDLLVGDRKIAGLLAEVVPPVPGAPTTPDGAPGPPTPGGAVVVGIGINVNWPTGWPRTDRSDPELERIASLGTALNRLVGREIDRDSLVERLLPATGNWSARARTAEGRRALTTSYRRRSSTIGRAVRVELAGETFVGQALDVDDAGCLLVESDANLRTVSAGDVVHLR